MIFCIFDFLSSQYFATRYFATSVGSAVSIFRHFIILFSIFCVPHSVIIYFSFTYFVRNPFGVDGSAGWERPNIGSVGCKQRLALEALRCLCVVRYFSSALNLQTRSRRDTGKMKGKFLSVHNNPKFEVALIWL